MHAVRIQMLLKKDIDCKIKAAKKYQGHIKCEVFTEQ